MNNETQTPEEQKNTTITSVETTPMSTSQDMTNTITPAAVTPTVNVQQPTVQQPIVSQTMGTVLTEPIVAPTTDTVPATKRELNAITLILQWLTYALWGWVLLPLIWVIFSVVFSIIGDGSVQEWLIYPIAAVMVLLPAAVITDYFYSRREPKTKKGAELIIMIIHAVIFVLFGLGFLIGAVFSLVSITINSGDSASGIASAISCIIIALLYALVSIRTIRPSILRPGWNNEEE